VFHKYRSQPVSRIIYLINPVLRGWVWSEPLKLNRFLRQVRIIKGIERGKDNE